MILQELIRNFFLYRDVLKPVIESWKNSLDTVHHGDIFNNNSSMLHLALNKAKILDGGEELGWDISDDYEEKFLSKLSGTRTITNQLTSSFIESDILYKAESNCKSALSSKQINIMLALDGCGEFAVNTGKTTYHDYCRDLVYIFLGTTKTISLTTGYESKQINSFLISETHEKREYLGEFSLTHEETPLMNFAEGGEHHDNY